MNQEQLLELVTDGLRKYRSYGNYQDLYNECVVAVWERPDLWDDEERIKGIVRRKAYVFTNFEDKLIPVAATPKNRKELSEGKKGKDVSQALENLLLGSEGFTDTLENISGEPCEEVDNLILEQDREFLQTCIKLFLTDHERNVLTLYLQEDTSVQEVADWQGTSTQAVYTTIERSVSKLRKMFENR